MTDARAPDAVALALRFSALAARGRCLCVSRGWRNAASDAALWEVLDGRDLVAAFGAGAETRIAALAARRPWAAVDLECCRRVGDAALDALDASRLANLNLNAAHGVSAAAMCRLLGRCGKLEALALYWQPRLEDAALLALAAARPPLATANLSGCQRVTDAGVAALLRACPSVAALDVTRCPRLTDATLWRIGAALGPALRSLTCYADAQLAAYDALAACPNLEALDCTGSRRLTGAAVAAVARAAGPRLRRLILSWCVAVDDAAGLAVARYCPNVDVLSFHGSTLVSDATVDALAAAPASTSLVALDVNGCARVTDYLRRAGTLAPRFPRVTRWTLHT